VQTYMAQSPKPVPKSRIPYVYMFSSLRSLAAMVTDLGIMKRDSSQTLIKRDSGQILMKSQLPNVMTIIHSLERRRISNISSRT
jgi:hypothetical protein